MAGRALVEYAESQYPIVIDLGSDEVARVADVDIEVTAHTKPSHDLSAAMPAWSERIGVLVD